MKPIDQKNIIIKEDWGISILTDTELEAYKTAYLYRYSPYGVIVEYAGGAKKWMVTVYNEIAKPAGMKGAK